MVTADASKPAPGLNADFHAIAGGIALIDVCLVVNQQFGVVSAFGRTNLERELHGDSPKTSANLML